MDLMNKVALYVGLMLPCVCFVACQKHVQSPVSADIATSIFYADFELQSAIYHLSDDSSEVHLRFSSEFLASKKLQGEDGYKAIHLRLLVTDSLQRIVDTVESSYYGIRLMNAAWLQMQERVAMGRGQYKIVVEIADQNKSNVSKDVLLADKRTLLSEQNFKLTRKNGEVIFDRQVKEGDTLYVHSDRNPALDSLEVWQFNQDTKLPPPPFSSNAVEMPDFKNAVRHRVAMLKGSATVIQAGQYQFLRGAGASQGFVIRKKNFNYPQIDNPSQLHMPMRYITTKGEFEEMSKASYSKPLVDRFWIESGGNKDRALEMVKIYYRRVEESNRYFTTYTEGWRTDRGMIYLVFGPPMELEQDGNQEKWHYGATDDDNAMVFTFNKTQSPLGMTHYQLKRDNYYKTGWEMMVNSWRNGRIRE
jgi:GWxTD domain-containing protein